MYQSACVACHKADGTGQPESVFGFETPIPDFTDCRFTTPEADVDWSSVVHMGAVRHRKDRRQQGRRGAIGFEPHYAEIREPGQVQIYESVMRDSGGRATSTSEVLANVRGLTCRPPAR